MTEKLKYEPGTEDFQEFYGEAYGPEAEKAVEPKKVEKKSVKTTKKGKK